RKPRCPMPAISLQNAKARWSLCSIDCRIRRARLRPWDLVRRACNSSHDGERVKTSAALSLGLFVIWMAGCSNGPTIYDDPSAIAVLSATQNNAVHGVATFVRMDGDVLVSVNMAGFKPNSVHGLHIHDSGDCSARDAASAGGHFNPTSSSHGGASGS